MSTEMPEQSQLPSWDEAIQQHDNALPSWSDVEKKYNPDNYTVPQAFGNLAYQTLKPSTNPEELTDAQRIWTQKQPLWNIVKAFGHGYGETYTSEINDIEEDTGTAFKNDYLKNTAPVGKALMDGFVIPAARTLATTYISAPFAGAQEALHEAGKEFVGEQFGRDLAAMPEAFIGEAPNHLPHEVAVAKANRVLDGEAVYFGTREPTEMQAAEIEKATTQFRAQGQEITEPPAPTIHDVARGIAPETFLKYDELSVTRDNLRAELNGLATERQTSVEATLPHTAEIADLKAKLEDANPRMAKKYQARLDDLEAKNDIARQEALRADTPEMAAKREELQKADYAMRDLSPDVTKAYREAEKQMPAPEPEAAPQEQTPEAPAPATAEAAPTEQGPPVKPIEDQKAFIAQDTVKKLTEVGRPQEESEAAAQLVAAHYEARAARFEGKAGTAEEMYLRDSPAIEAGKNRVVKKPILSQKTKGKIQLATEDAKAAITLFKTADASTFIHETGHHWLDELIRDSREDLAPNELKKNAETVRKWLGTDGGEFSGFTKRQHEKFARGFERYMMEGISPSRELDGVFAKFKQWLNALYQIVDRLKSPINNDIRDVFDRLLAVSPERATIAPEVEKATAEAAQAPEVVAPAPLTREPSAPAKEAPTSQIAKAIPASEKEASKVRPESPNTKLPPPESDLVDKAGNIRLDNLNTPEEVNQILRETAAQNNNFLGARRNVISDAQVSDLADALGMSADSLNTRKIGEAFNAEEILAARKLLIQSAVELRDFMIKAATGDEEAIMAYAQAKARHMMIQGQVAGITSEAGRAMRAFHSLEGAEEAQALGEFLKQATGKDLFQLQEEARLGAQLETAQQISKFINDSKKAKFSDMILEFWINALLSGPMTHVKNMLGNLAVAVNSTAETAGAAAIGSVREIAGNTGERVYGGEAGARLFGIVQGARDGLRAGIKSFKTEEVGAGAHTIEQASRKNIPGALGKAVRLPGRALTAEDEVFKAIAYRQELNAQAYRIAMNEGLTGDAFNQRIAELTMNPSEELMEAAKKNAEYQTFTNKLGQVGRSIQAFSNSHFLAKLVVPFLRTPVNILKYAGERTPLGLFSREVQANITGKNGKIAQDTQIARLAIGTAMGTTFMSLASEGKVTGGGPSDPKEKAMWRLAGNQPYSIKVGDTWYSYGWLDPFATILGVSADMAQITKTGADTGEDGTKIAAALFSSISQNLMSKLSLRGVSDLIQAVTDPQRYGEGYIQNLIGTIVPSAVAQAARADDPVMRQARTALDALKARIPGYRETLFPVRDVWGEPIVSQGSLGPNIASPIYEQRASQDPVNQTLEKLRIFPDKLDRKIRGVDLTDQQYDDYTRMAGRMAKMRLNQLVVQPGFDAVPDYNKTKAINKIIETSREQARSLIMMKNPDIVRQATENKLREIRGIKH